MAKKKLTLEDAIVKDGPYEVPGNWVWTRIKFIGNIKGGKRLPKGKQLLDFKTEYPYIRVADFDSGTIDISELKYLDEESNKQIRNYTISSKDVYVSIAGSIGKVGIIPDCLEGANLTENAAKITDIVLVSNKYLYYLLLSDKFQRDMQDASIATTQAKLALYKIGDLIIPIPPLKEQQRIVDRIESLFEKLDKANELIEEARDGFEKRRGLILNEVFKGNLTRNYRLGNKEKDDANKLILAIREQLEYWYKEECNRAKAKGTKKPRKLNFDIVKSEFEHLFKSIPSTWRISYFQEIIEPVENALKAGPFGSNLKKSMYVNDGYKIYGQEQVISGDIGYGDYYIDEDKFEELKTCEVREGDLLISLVGTIGKTLIIPKEHKKGVINPRLLKISINKNIDGQYISRYFESPIAKYIMSETSHGGTMEILNLDIIKKLPIPIPPREEQKEIVKILDKLLEEESKIEELTQLEEQIELIKKAILAKAFRGEIGTNCEEDESALELLKEMVNR